MEFPVMRRKNAAAIISGTAPVLERQSPGPPLLDIHRPRAPEMDRAEGLRRGAARFDRVPRRDAEGPLPRVVREFDETETALTYNIGYSPSGGTSLYLGLERRNFSTGGSVHAGVALDLGQAARLNAKGSLSVGLGDIRAGLMSDGSPHIGVSSVGYVAGRGAGVGVFTVGGRGIPRISVESAVLLAGFSVIDGMIHGKRPAVMLSETAPKLLPVNTAREFISFLHFVWGKSGGPPRRYSSRDIKKAMAFLKSAENQGLVYGALIRIDEMLASVCDPYLAAMLMERRDYFVVQISRLLPIGSRFGEKLSGPAGAISSRVERSIERSEAFVQKYGAWLEGRAADAPSVDKINTYMTDALYLSQKLALTVKQETKDGKLRLKITSSSPFMLESVGLMSKYLGAVRRAYQALENPESGVFDYIAKKIEDANVRFVSHIKDPGVSTEAALEWRNKVDSTLGWIIHMRRMAHFYPLRQQYCLWRASREEDSPMRFDHMTSIAAISGPSEGVISSNLRQFVSRPAITAAVARNGIIAVAADTLAGIEELRTQQPFENLLDIVVHATDIVVRGLDFAGVIDEHRPLQGEAARLFGLLRHYRILRETGWPKTTREYDDCELFRAIFLRAERSFRLAAQRRPEEFSREISRASTSLQDKKKWLEMLVRGTYADMRDLMSMVTEPISGVHEMMQPTLNDFSQLREMISSIRTRGWTNLIQIIDADVEDTRQITIIIQSARAALVGSKEVVADRRSQLEKLRDETADTSEKEGHEDALDRLSDLEKKLDAVLKSLSRLDADLSDFFTHRAGSVLMKGIQ